jgi:hypothetical protein
MDYADDELAPRRSRLKVALLAAGALVVLFFVLCAVLPHAKPSPAEPVPGPFWQYRVYRDDMSGETTQIATVDSVNAADLDFPYAGGSPLTLQVTTDAHDYKTVSLILKRGQFDCGDRCNIAIKADNRPMQWLHGHESTCGKYSCLMLSKDYGDDKSPEAFDAVQSAGSRFEASVPLYQFGDYHYVFNTTGGIPAPMTKRAAS